MGKLTFKMVAAYDINSFNDLVNQYLEEGYRFMPNAVVMITPHEDISGKGVQYSVQMLHEEGAITNG